MENSKPLATESFSYSWLIDTKPPSFDGLPNSFISIFPQNSIENEQNFDFGIPFLSSPPSIVHADEIFLDGHIMPVYVKRSKVEALRTSTSMPSSPLTLCSSRNQFLDAENKSQLRKWRKSSKRILRKWFGFVRPLCKTMGCLRKNSKVDDLERKVFEVESLSNSLVASPRRSPPYSVVEFPSSASNSWSCDAESSIHEAILYCKRSIEK